MPPLPPDTPTESRPHSGAAATPAAPPGGTPISMKVNLTVTAAGANNGRQIPITVAKFLIGRDPQCHLRPTSPAISKQHCAVLVRDGQVYVEDYGSTNGTLVNDVPVSGEVLVENGDRLKVGPLDFKLDIQATQRKTDSTPLPDALKPLAGSGAAEKLRAAAGQPAAKLTPAAQKPVPKPAPPPTKPVPIKSLSLDDTVVGDDPDVAAAMLLGMDDEPGGEPQVAEGSTVMEMVAVDAQGNPVKPPPAAKAPAPESSATAGDLLKKYFRRGSS